MASDTVSDEDPVKCKDRNPWSSAPSVSVPAAGWRVVGL
jgi:hypothetical protein